MNSLSFINYFRHPYEQRVREAFERAAEITNIQSFAHDLQTMIKMLIRESKNSFSLTLEQRVKDLSTFARVSPWHRRILIWSYDFLDFFGIDEDDPGNPITQQMLFAVEASKETPAGLFVRKSAQDIELRALFRYQRAVLEDDKNFVFWTGLIYSGVPRVEFLERLTKSFRSYHKRDPLLNT